MKPADPATIYNERIKSSVILCNAVAVGVSLVAFREALQGLYVFLVFVPPMLALHGLGHYLLGRLRKEP
ncbi:hypothetical protein [Roseivivax sediminis]|uniref:2TM domain-containing protein n=1 Tax=Roseivivax sediminis TaxID=936889 RepID=A0A1I2CPC0_9RHOB|nr:hypothetical protein [Roseivivax sediminis]SFE69643.1 hypothetical protein SAMN04515678_11411 [Roseivivax sediminis]